MTPLAAYIDAHEKDLLALLARLVRLPTVNPPGDHYDAITRLLAAELKAAGLAVRRPRVPDALLRKALPKEQWGRPRWNVIGRLPAGRGAKGAGAAGESGRAKTLHFNAHYDVVPVSGVWRHGDAFSGVAEGGWLYGRGAADMKGAISSLILALRALRETGLAPALNVEVSFTADEETDSALGAGWVVRQGGVRPDYALVLEGGEGRRIGCGHNGVVWLEVTVHGRAAHGSTPEDGVNALEHMSRLVLALGEHAREIGRRGFTAPDGAESRPTLNLGGVFSSGEGGKINTVPALARFSIDRRVIPSETAAEAERELRGFLAAAARKIPGCRITVKKISENHPSYASPEHPFAKALARHVARQRRCRPVFSCSTGFNDMQFFAQVLKVPTLGYGPVGQDFHAVDERVSVKELLAAARIYAGLMVEGVPE